MGSPGSAEALPGHGVRSPSGIPGSTVSSTRGVSVEVGRRQAAVEVTVVVEHGVAITELARAIRRKVIGAVERTTGLQIVEVNVEVVDLDLASVGRRAGAAPASVAARVR